MITGGVKKISMNGGRRGGTEHPDPVRGRRAAQFTGRSGYGIQSQKGGMRGVGGAGFRGAAPAKHKMIPAEYGREDRSGLVPHGVACLR
jgi:hypothetical protein